MQHFANITIRVEANWSTDAEMRALENSFDDLTEAIEHEAEKEARKYGFRISIRQD